MSSTVAVVAFFFVGRTASSGMGVSTAVALDVGSYHILVD